MNPVKTIHTTRILGAPRKWDEQKDGKCDGLPVVDGDGFLASFWKPTWKDRLLILMGRYVRVLMVGLASLLVFCVYKAATT